MVPSVFISSTIEDLHYLRDAIRQAVEELSYASVMSEYGDVGYLPTSSAEDSCYVGIRQCHLAVMIIGKRYGSLTAEGRSVTHKEFRAARDRGLPVICLVDSEVAHAKRIYDANKGAGLVVPGMDNPAKTFGFLQEIQDSRVNNGVLPYTNGPGACQHLKRQLAHLFGEFLRGQFDPVKADVKDILSEIKTLRHELGGERGGGDARFLAAVRFLVDDASDSAQYRSLLTGILATPIDAAIPLVLKAATFADLVRQITGKPLERLESMKVRQVPTSSIAEKLAPKGIHIWTAALVKLDRDSPLEAEALWGLGPEGQLAITPEGERYFERIHSELRSVVDGQRTFPLTNSKSKQPRNST
jgi:Domain of unknown function (DUF4062)